MAAETMTSMQRVLAALSHQEPDRVPYFLLFTMHGARELGIPIREYFSRPELVVEGQLRLREKYGHDCLVGFLYAPVEVEAFGGEVIFIDDGPPNSGRPFITDLKQIAALTPPDIGESPCLQNVLATIRGLKEAAGDEVPVMGVAVSPFSLPVMQMGFGSYIELLYGDRTLFDSLMEVNEQFCVAWANAQLEAGATAIVYFDPVSSPSMVPRELYLETGHAIARRTIPKINGATATHFASGRCLPIIDEVAATGTLAVSASALEDLGETKDLCQGRLAVVGNLNGIEMARWSVADAETRVREAMAGAASGGGFILADNHGEIPWQVGDNVLHAIADAARRWGTYPLSWD